MPSNGKSERLLDLAMWYSRDDTRGVGLEVLKTLATQLQDARSKVMSEIETREHLIAKVEEGS